MANASTTGFGLRAVMTVGNTPATSGQSEYKVKLARCSIVQNNPISLQDAGDVGFITRCTAFTLLMMVETAEERLVGGTNAQPRIGVFNGYFSK